MLYSQEYYQENEENANNRTDPRRSISDESLNLQTYKVKVKEDNGNKTEPVDDAVCHHVFVVSFEVS